MSEKPTLNIVLVEPRIPQNTGNVARTCACTACRLHLVGPMGFAIDDKKLKHAGLDYWHYLDISYYDSLDDFFSKNDGPFYYFTTKAPQRYTDVAYPDGAYLVFGREDAGLPEALLAADQEHCIRMPMRDTCRSLNLSNSVAVGVYEVLRQWDFPELLDHGHLRRLGPTKEVTAEYRKFEKKDAMKADGTINRAALPAIFNPEDLNALEQALRLKDAYPGTTVTLLTMGPGRAAEIIREGLYRGADGGFLLTDRAFAGADTLATSYALATAIKKINDYDIIIGGRQAIDGDTAQVGPQVAEKLGLTQITYAEEILNVDKEAGRITVKRHIDGGVETVEGPLPIVITVNGSAAPCRPRNAKLVQKYKHAMGKQERAVQPACHQDGTPTLRYPELYETRPYLDIQEWSVADVNGDLVQCGLSGSPTKVKAIENIVFQAKESKTISSADQEVEDLIVELLANHTIG